MEMKVKHTPGPWCFGTFHRLLVVPMVNGVPDKHHVIADIGEGAIPYTDAAEDYANAALIAASPELLEALEKLIEAYSYYFPIGNPWGDRARAAIAAATGEQT